MKKQFGITFVLCALICTGCKASNPPAIAEPSSVSEREPISESAASPTLSENPSPEADISANLPFPIFQPTEANYGGSDFWDEIVELVSTDGRFTTAYKLEDGQYMDNANRILTYDGGENWFDAEGIQWCRRSVVDSEEKIPFFAEFAIDRFLTQRPDAIFYDDAPNSKYPCKVVFSTDSSLTDVGLYEITAVPGQDGKLYCMHKELRYSLGNFSEDNLLVIQMELEGVLPTRAISCTNAEGITRFYAIAQSGEDYVPVLIRLYSKS